MTEQTFYYVPKPMAQEYIALGWKPHGSLEGTHHGCFSILMEGCGDGEPRIPKQTIMDQQSTSGA